MNLGTLYIISAPSGAGKSSLITALLEKSPNYTCKVSISHTTRAPRQGEMDGVHYYFIDEPEFKSLQKKNVFLEHARVFDSYYGTSRVWIEEQLQQGIDIFLDIDWQGARQIREQISNTQSIFILPPSTDELKRRLIVRAQDSAEVIQNRMTQAIKEITHYKEYDFIIINDDFDKALFDFKSILNSQRLKIEKQEMKYQQILDSLLNSSI